MVAGTDRAGPAPRRRVGRTVAIGLAVLAIAVLVIGRDRGGAGPAPTGAEVGATTATARPAGPPRLRAARPIAATAAVSGIVVDEAGAPVASARVLLTGHAEVGTGADGRFTIAGVAAGAYHLNAHAATAAAGPLPIAVDGAPQFVTVRLHPGVSLAVAVVSVTDGRPLPGARGRLGLSTTLGDAGALEAIADAGGVLRFPVAALGNYQITAEADGHAPATRLLTWNDRAGLAWTSTIALEPGVVLRGRVVDEAGAPIAGARVRARGPARDHTQIAYRPRPPELLRPAAITDADGGFRYPVPVGQGLVLVASHERHVTGESATIAAARAGSVTITLRRGRAITGRVVDGDGQPVAGATVSDGPPETGPAHLTRTDADGQFALTGVDPRAPRLALFAATAAARSAPALVALPDGFEAPIELTLAHAAQLAGTVVDASGAAVADAVVAYQRALPDEYQPAATGTVTPIEAVIGGEVRADGSGAFAITGLAAGSYRLLVRAPAAAGDRVSPPLMAQAIATAGAADVVVTLPAPAAIRGRVVTADGQPARALTVAVVGFGGDRRADGADGGFALAGLDPTPGRYQLRLTADGAATLTVDATVGAGRTTELGTLTLAAGRIVRGRVVDAAGTGPIAQAWVAIDDAAGHRVASGRSDELGYFAIPAPAAAATVHAAATSVGNSGFVAVPADGVALALRVPETGRLEVAVSGDEDPATLTVTATRTDAPDGSFRIWILKPTADGTFAAEVSPGPYRIDAAHGRTLEATRGRGGAGAGAAGAAGATVGSVATTVTAGQTQRLTVAPGV